jgi:hypothetical protein
MESVDYQDTFITVAPDSAAVAGAVPQPKAGKPTVASATFEMIANNPYAFRSSDVIFTVWADRRDIPAADRRQAWAEFYATGQACLRGSDLGKRYGWGIHADDDGRLAVYAVGSDEYEAFAAGRSPLDGKEVTVRAAMRSKR